MSPLQLASAPVLVLIVGAVLALLLSRDPRRATAVGVGAAVLACTIGLGGSLWLLATGVDETWVSTGWRMPLAALVVGVDPLSAFFAVPVFAIGGLAAVYGGSYLRAQEGAGTGAAWFAYDLLLAGMATLLLARNGMLFLFAWEVMSLSAWALVSFEHHRAEVRRAGFVYLVATHAGTAALFVLFLVLREVSGGSADFTALGAATPPASLLLVLALIGFGAKAGLVPLHVWLPEAHAAAPSHVSALMSAVVVKMGIYGILRTVLVVGGPPGWLGPALLGLGLLGAVLGVGLALSQRDLKRALAYSTIENLGIITAGLGIGFSGATLGHPTVAALGLGGALLHVWNHALAKGLLFLSAGSVLHGAGTRDLERLGGLLQRMPRTGGLMIVGAAAIAALPPLNGFAGEWLLYRAMLEGGRDLDGLPGLGLLLALAVLAFVGALAVAAFARLIGVVLLGAPRTDAAAHAHEPDRWMLGPMGILAVGCVAMGLAPAAPLRLVAPAVVGMSAAPPDPGGLWVIGVVGAVVWVAVGAGVLLIRRVRSRSAPTWGCGYPAPTSRIQYTGRAFAQLGADHLLPRALRPVTEQQVPHEPFPPPATLRLEYPDPVLERGYLPSFRRWAERFGAVRRLQQGRSDLYVAYIGLVLVLALAWATLRSWEAS